MKRYLNIRMTVIMTLLLLCVVLAPAKQASAAGGNVQLKIYSLDSTKITFLRISGFNQNNKYSIWERSFNPSVSETSINNWWWNSSLKYVRIHFSNGQRYECQVVTMNYVWMNWDTVGIGSDGSIRASGPRSYCSRI